LVVPLKRIEGVGAVGNAIELIEDRFGQSGGAGQAFNLRDHLAVGDLKWHGASRLLIYT
jgi:hypothetical protein